MKPPSTPIHLRKRNGASGDVYVWTMCHITTYRWTDDPQAVTCQKCADQMDLQPA